MIGNGNIETRIPAQLGLEAITVTVALRQRGPGVVFRKIETGQGAQTNPERVGGMPRADLCNGLDEAHTAQRWVVEDLPDPDVRCVAGVERIH
jgi:hypothetical protein